LGFPGLVFRDRFRLSSSYVPGHLLYRDVEVGAILSAVRSLLDNGGGGLLVYGPPGSGKTVIARFVLRALGSGFSGVYVDCGYDRTGLRLGVSVALSLGVSVPYTRLSTSGILYRVSRALLSAESSEVPYVFVFDNIERLEVSGVRAIQDLGRVTGKFTRAAFIGLTSLNPRSGGLNMLLDVFGDIIYELKPYTLEQLEGILNSRVEEAFKPGVVDPEVVKLIARLAIEEGGGARLAIELLKRAGELAESMGSARVRERHVIEAYKTLKEETILEIVKTLTTHGKLTLKAITDSTNNGRREAETGEIYRKYRELAEKHNIKPATQRHVGGIITQLQQKKIVNCKTISKGRYGKTRLVKLTVNPETIQEALKEDLYD